MQLENLKLQKLASGIKRGMGCAIWNFNFCHEKVLRITATKNKFNLLIIVLQYQYHSAHTPSVIFWISCSQKVYVVVWETWGSMLINILASWKLLPFERYTLCYSFTKVNRNRLSRSTQWQLSIGVHVSPLKI